MDMKTTILMSLVLAFPFLLMAQTPGKGQLKKEIESAIRAFALAGDQQNSAKMQEILGENFRAVVSSPEKGVGMVLDKATYLSMLEQKKIGGDRREVKIGKIELVSDHVASARVILKGSKADFETFISVVKSGGKWVLVQDLVKMTAH